MDNNYDNLNNNKYKNRSTCIIALICGLIMIVLVGYSIYYFGNLSNDNIFLDDSKEEESNNNKENSSDDFNENEDTYKNNENDNTENDENNEINSFDTVDSYFKQLDINDFVNFIENKENFILVISQTLCSHCTNYKPKVEEIANNYKLIIYYIEYDLLSEDSKNIFNSYVDFSGTPTTLFYNNGEELFDNRISGNVSSDRLINILRTNNYIK